MVLTSVLAALRKKRKQLSDIVHKKAGALCEQPAAAAAARTPPAAARKASRSEIGEAVKTKKELVKTKKELLKTKTELVRKETIMAIYMHLWAEAEAGKLNAMQFVEAKVTQRLQEIQACQPGVHMLHPQRLVPLRADGADRPIHGPFYPIDASSL